MSVHGVEPDFPSTEVSSLRVVDVATFVRGVDAGADPLLLGPGGVALPADGLAIEFGDPGTGKTTREIDLAVHAASGIPWLGLTPVRPLEVLIVEGEGPRQPFREKLGRRLAAWPHDLTGGISVLEEPWARVSLAVSSQRAELAAAIRDRQIDLLMIGPLKSVGASGVGSPDDVAEFRLILSDLRRLADRPFGIWLVHHTNKAGGMAGGWAGETDLTIHVRAEHGTRDRHALLFEKARWDSELHGRKWIVGWGDHESVKLLDDGSRDAVETRVAEQRADEEAVLAWLREHVGRYPSGVSKTAVEDAFTLLEEDDRPGSRAALRRVILRLKAASDLGGFTDPAVMPGGKAGQIRLIPASGANLQPAEGAAAGSAGSALTLLEHGNPQPAAPPIGGGRVAAVGGAAIDEVELDRLEALEAEIFGEPEFGGSDA